MSEIKLKRFKRAIKFCSFFCLVFLFAVGTQAAWQTIGNVTRVVQTAKKNGVILDTSSRAKVSVEFFDINAVRVRIAPEGKLEREFSYAFDYSVDRKTPTMKLTQTAKEIVLTNGFGAKVVIQKMPFAVKVFDESGKLVVEDDAKHPTSFDTATGEIRTTKMRRSEVETYYGFGEKAFIEMSRNGKYIVNWNTDTFAYPTGTDPIYQSIPFFYALHDGKAYGLFFNNTFRSYFDMGTTSPERYSFGADGGELDYFVFTGGKENSPKKVLEDYANLTGKTPLPPIWALGNQQSRWSYFPESRIREIADGFRKNKIPADVIYLDIDYMDEYRVFTWDKKRFPNPSKMISDLKADGFKTVLIIDPGIKVDENYLTYTDGLKNNIYVKNADGSNLIKNVWAKESTFPDFTDPKAREWFGAQYKKHLEEGIAGFWNDMNEPGVFMTGKTEKPEIYHHPDKTFPYDTPHACDGFPDTHRRYHNVYGMQMARSSFEGLRKLAPDVRPFVLTRAGFSGVQRYSAVWTGDNYAAWEHLALSIPMLANMSVSGVPFVGADVGGFAEMPSAELYARWLQAGALTPFFRSHSVGWVGNKEPWAFGDEWTKINRQTVELRYQFLPYLYTLFREHERTGQPVMRPLWYEFPNDKLTYLINDQYMVGSDVMVAPVTKQGVETRGIYLPVGADWVDWWTGARFESGKTHYLKTPIDRVPIFVRVGAVIPTQSVIQHTGEMPNAEITLNVITGIAPNKTETSMLFQDAGEGYGYRKNDWREIKFEHKQGSLLINKYGNFNGQKIKYIEAVGMENKAKETKADGKVLDQKFDSDRKRVRVEVVNNVKEILMLR
ncbi:glycoside hydrolase family 31 protein [soil metagenome]